MCKLINYFFTVILAINFSFTALVFGQIEGAKNAPEYHISANDLLSINVYDEPDLTVTVRVNSEGNIVYPLLGSLLVKGFTSTQLEEKLTALLGESYLVNPQVSVLVKEHGSVSILGKIKHPGTQELKSGMTVLDAIIAAGGFTEDADPENVRLVRIKGKEKETISVNVKEALEKGNTESDIFLEPEDLIIVGSPIATGTDWIIVFGQVKNPGKYDYKKGMTVLEAVALSGGLTQTAAADATKIIRVLPDGNRETVGIPLNSILRGGNKNRDINLQPGDTVVVPESFF